MEDKRAQYSEDEILTLEFDDGESFECGIMGVFDLDEKQYIALEAFDDTNDVYLYEYVPTDDDFCGRIFHGSPTTFLYPIW